MIRIGIDAHGLGGHSLGLGNETYFRHLVKNLAAIDARNEYHVFVNHPDELDELRAHPNVRLVSLWPHTQWVQRPISLPFYAARHGLDLLHCPFIRPPLVTAKTIVTVHDACFEEYPQHFRRHELWRLRWLVPRSCQSSDLIFTVSHYAVAQLHRLYGVPLEKMVVTYNAADHTGPQGAERTTAPPVMVEGNPFILYVGLIQPRKNLARLVKAFGLLRERGLPHHLVLAGRRGWGNEALDEVVAASPHRHAIHFLGYVRHDAFTSVMANASVFAFPSEFESFGIPPMEAQRWGVPVVVSNNTCFGEIYGDSAEYCIHDNVEDIARALTLVLTDEARRASLREKGYARSAQFSWRRTAEVALAAYERLAGEMKVRAAS